MKEEFFWKQEYSVGDKEIDSQHKQMFYLLNSIPEKGTESNIRDSVLFLTYYIRKHFIQEEKFMESVNYPELTDHREKHSDIAAKLSELCISEFKSPEGVHHLKKFVNDWVAQHILKDDKDFFIFVSRMRE